ncbi:MAG: hypothetical protein HY454_02845, partial [Parcubacteria group bacterium]|nr:hypothetical protein [Parcubacteria group bacterium]
MANVIKFVGVVVLGIAALTVVGGPLAGDFLAPRGGVYASVDRGGVWQRSGKVEGANINRLDVTAIVHNPKDPRILYMGTLGDAVLKSVDSGATWHRLEDQNKVLDRRANVYSVAVDYTLPDYGRKKPDRFYLGVYQNDFGRILRTEDGGVSFKEVYVASRPQYAVFVVVLDPREPNVIWAGTAEGLLLRSRDYGETWKLVQEFPGVIN